MRKYVLFLIIFALTFSSLTEIAMADENGLASAEIGETSLEAEASDEAVSLEETSASSREQSQVAEDMTMEETVETQAEALNGVGEEVYYEEAIYINPLYIDVVTEDDLNQSVSGVMTADVADYGTESEAVEMLREALEARQSTVTVYVATDSYVSGQSGTMMSLFDQAMEHTGVPTQGDYLKWQYGLCSVAGSYSIKNGVYYLSLSYTITYYTTAAQEAEVTAKLKEVMSSMELEGKSDAEKVCAIYEYICENVTYDNDNLNDDTYKLKYTAYAALINGTSVCQGYAVLFYRMVLEAGIDARVISGTSGGADHAWNIVQLDGYYYNMDATWDASYYVKNATYKYRLRCNAYFSDHTRDSEYSTVAFTTTYLMDTKDYGCNGALTHSYDDGVITTAATCTEDGVMTYTCGVCGATYTEIIAANGHIYGGGTVTTQATATTAGVMTYVCTSCGTYITEVIPATADVNMDGEVNGKDLIFLRQYLAGNGVTINEDAADVNGDGSVNGRDLIYLRKALAGG